MNPFNLPQNNKKRVVKNNFHQFQPLFYQVATSGIEPGSISFPVRKIFQKHANLHFRNTALKQINPANKQIETTNGPLLYDYLVLAPGVGNNYFNSESIEKYGLPMKSTAEAIYVRNRILGSFEKAILTQIKQEQASLMSVVIVGGGPTGVELSGAIAEMKNEVLYKDYPELDFSLMQIQLFEAGPRLLNGMSEKAGNDARNYLERLGVQVHLNQKIEDYDGEKVSLGSGTSLNCRNLIWTAGVRGFSLSGLPESVYARGNRIKVDAVNQVMNLPGVFAIGDCAYQTEEKYPDGHPQVAQVAIQQAKHLAKNLKTEKWKAFSYRNKGSLATIGRNMAVADLPAMRLSGFVAWLLWLFVHLMSIVGVKNRLFVFINWAQSYILRDQSLRVIIKPFRKKN
jgi:NADH dehydrogenase